MTRRQIVLSAGIAGFWLVMMGLLVRNHILSRWSSAKAVEISPDQLTEEWRDYEEWMRLIVARHSQGLSYTAIRRRPDRSGYTACNRIWLDLDLWGTTHTFRLQTVASLDSLFQLDRAAAEMRLDDSQMAFAALCRGMHFYYRWQFEGQTRTGMQKMERAVSLLEAVRPLAPRQLELEVGAVYRLPVLDSTWSLREGWVEMRVAAREQILVGGKMVEALRLVIQLGPFATTTWVSPKGEVLRREFGGNLFMEQVDPQRARAQFPGIDAPVEVPPLRVADFATTGSETAPPREVAPFDLLLELFRQPPPDR